MQKVLAIDFGTTRIGLALSYGSLAEPLLVIPHDDKVFTTLKQVCQEHHVTLVLFGLSENVMAEKTKAFAQDLQNQLQLPVEYTDETLSSYETHQKLRLAKRSKKQGPIDHFAAAHFLQEWLDGNGG